MPRARPSWAARSCQEGKRAPGSSAPLSIAVVIPHRIWSASVVLAERSTFKFGLGSTPMIGFDAEAVHREFGLAEDEVPVMLLSVGPERPGNWPQKPRLPVGNVLEL